MKEGVNINGKESDTLFIFDLDETLIISTAKIKVLDSKGNIIKELTPAEYNYYTKTDNTHMLNFDEFQDFGILKHSVFTKYFGLLKKEYNKGTHICILTARGNNNLIQRFFQENDILIHPDLCIAITDVSWGFVGNTAERKKQAIRSLVGKGYKNFTFFDDNLENLKSAKDLETEFNIRIKMVHAKN